RVESTPIGRAHSLKDINVHQKDSQRDDKSNGEKKKKAFAQNFGVCDRGDSEDLGITFLNRMEHGIPLPLGLTPSIVLYLKIYSKSFSGDMGWGIFQKKTPREGVFLFVAGVGFEPTTSRL